jgi:hypothetical protein
MSLGLLGCLCLVVAGQDAKGTDDVRHRQLRQALDESVSWNAFFKDDQRTQPMTPQPVHRWTNNERDPQGQGLAVLWIHRGRPEVAASIYPWQGKLIHELESLSRSTFVCLRDDEVRWQPAAGISFRRVPQTEPPATTAVGRLRQMKEIAERFTVTMTGWNPTDADREILRRLPRELYRYRPEDAGLVDGAVFAFVKGTDPEALLMLEAVRTPAGAVWEYALVRQTSGGVQAVLDGETVWTVEKHVPRNDPRQPFFSLGAPLVLSPLAETRNLP